METELTSKVFEMLFEKLPQSVNILALPKQEIITVSSDEVLKDIQEVFTKEKLI